MLLISHLLEVECLLTSAVGDSRGHCRLRQVYNSQSNMFHCVDDSIPEMILSDNRRTFALCARSDCMRLKVEASTATAFIPNASAAPNASAFCAPTMPTVSVGTIQAIVRL